MEIQTLAHIFACPACGGNVRNESHGLVCKACAHLNRVTGNNVLCEAGADQSEEWLRQQTESIDRYSDDSYEEDRTLATLFGNFIAVSLDRTMPVLDVGCGLFPDEPSYVSDLALPHYIGMEPIPRVVERDYLCLVGAVAEAVPVKDGTLGAAIFSTSLDHIETVHEAIADVCRALAPKGRLFFWNGMHDPHLLAEAKNFGNIVNRSHGWRKAARIIGAPLEYAALYRRMAKNRRFLAEGRPLDHAHVRYFTTDTISPAMTSYGLEIVRQILVPGSNAHFIEARPKSR